MTVWKEKQQMKNLITGLDDMKLETFEGEWEEHDLMDGWMLDVMVSSLGDEDVVMACEDASEEMEVSEDDMTIVEWLESILHRDVEDDNMDVYEDWLENELNVMMVDDETITRVRNKSLLKFAPSEAIGDKHTDITIYSV